MRTFTPPLQSQVDAAVAKEISVVVPVFNEVDSLGRLHSALREVLGALGRSYEIIFVDDGSSDGSLALLKSLAEADGDVVVVELRRNFGKSAALAAGFDWASGDIIVTMDADLQDSPEEIPSLIQKLGEGYDLVNGWKWPRLDPRSKTMPSRIFNYITTRVTGVPLHDMNCGFKAYRREILDGMRVYGELHRFMPVLAHAKGYRVTEVKVKHRPRTHGKSKFGVERYLRGFLDLLTIKLLTTYNRRPLHLFGSTGLVSTFFGLAILLYLVGGHIWFLVSGDRSYEFYQTRPALTFAVLLIAGGLNFIFTGLIAELIISIGGRHADEKPYAVKTVLRRYAEGLRE